MSSLLTFKLLREANRRRLPTFKNAKGEPAHKSIDGSDWSNAQWLQAVVGELGELANFMKKVDRGDFSLADAHKVIAYELADVQIYLDLLAFRLNVDLGAAVVEKFNISSKRVGSVVEMFDDGSELVPILWNGLTTDPQSMTVNEVLMAQKYRDEVKIDYLDIPEFLRKK
jgi:NTP pyrophosphatase (non-canonical NTP hydrolase)